MDGATDDEVGFIGFIRKVDSVSSVRNCVSQLITRRLKAKER